MKKDNQLQKNKKMNNLFFNFQRRFIKRKLINKIS
jgi:hypothetical protein